MLCDRKRCGRITCRRASIISLAFLGALFPLPLQGRDVWDSPYSASFPGKTAEVSSPNRLLRIKDRFDAGEHTLLLLDHHHKTCPIENPLDGSIFHRCVDILWNPDSTSFVLNYWRGSEKTVSYLYKIDNLENPIDINARIQGELDNRLGKENLKPELIGFLYVFGDRWLNTKSIKIEVKGSYALPLKRNMPKPDARWTVKEFSLTYIWNLKNSFVLIDQQK
jgi:hypothetical protein